jgi:methylase of polypeptide subunit release factors
MLLKGAPFIPTKVQGVEKLLSMIHEKSRQKLVDIGSGDGRIVIAAAKRGIQSDGIEINPLLVWWSRRKIKEQHLEHLASIHSQDLWKTDFSSYDIATIFGVPYIMGRLEQKLLKEMRTGSQVISLGFQFPNWPPKEKRGAFYLYQK